MRSWKLSLVCMICLVGTSPAAVIQNADQALDRVIQTLLPAGADDVVLKIWGPIAEGTPIRGTREWLLAAPALGYSIYIDDYPTANLFHPVRYAFVSAATGEVQTFAAASPPQNEPDYMMIETAIGKILISAQNRRAAMTKHEPPPPTRSDRWAVLMSGGYNQSNNHVRYWNDLSNMYMALTETYGFADDHIIVLCSDGLNPAVDQSNGQNSNPDLDGDGDADIMYSCVLSNVDLVFGQLASALAEDDKLFVFTTDHGDTQGGRNTVENLWNMEILTDAHFAALLDALPDCEIIGTFEPCYSGGFLDNVVVPPGPRVASSACAYNQLSYAMSSLVYDEYVFHWTAAVKGLDAYGVPVDADYNSDGIISMDEAYRYAVLHDQATEDPQYDDEPNGCGAGISLWPTGAGPFLVVSQQLLDDIGGNNNGAPDPGENLSMVLTLSNVGSDPASGIVGTLSTTNTYLTITQNSSSYPNLGHFEQGAGAPPYMLTVSDECPQGETVSCALHITANGGAYTNDVAVSFLVGDVLYDPVGPDAYGYYAYDQLDQPLGPEYNWTEIAPAGGGSGTVVSALTGQDDRSALVSLPFSFRYYGQNYTQLTICTNGWLALGNATADSDWSNSQIPNADGPPLMIAPFWEDMNMESGGQIATYFNASQGLFIVEYYRIPQFTPPTAIETFEVVFYDPAIYPTSTGDGRILVQYSQVSDPTSCTVGIENGNENIGLQYLFDGTYDQHAAPLQAGSAILFTTPSEAPSLVITLTPYGTPILIPATGGNFSFNIAVSNNGGSSANFDVWCNVTLPGGTVYGPLIGPVNLTLPGAATLNRDRNQAVPGSAPAGIYTYNGYLGNYPSMAWSEDHFDFTKLGNGFGSVTPSWLNWGEDFQPPQVNAARPEEITLDGVRPNPFNPTTAISYELRAASCVSFRVYDTAGRMVADLVHGWREAGAYNVTFDGTNLASGIYVYRLNVGSFNASGKMVLMK